MTVEFVVREFQWYGRRFGGLRLDGFVDLRVVAPLHVFGNGSSSGARLDSRENLQLALGVVGSPRLPVLIEQLKMRSGEIRIEFLGDFELFQTFFWLSRQPIETAEVVMRNGFVRHQLRHAFKLVDSDVVVAFFLERDA